MRDVVAVYDAAAPELFQHYEEIPFSGAHGAVMRLLPESSSNVLDVGAGSGRDAAWFAAHGHNVVAVEPSAGLRNAGRKEHRSSRIRWLDDRLPTLEKVLRSKASFDLVWVSAVWHHLPASQRRRAFRKLVSVLSPGGSIMISLRQGPPSPGRPLAPVSAAEVSRLALDHGLQIILEEKCADWSGRSEVSWDVVWLQLPDDGTGALPLLRHIVFNDKKSSTYKPALLRVLLRIADGAAGFARDGPDDDHVDLPLGLVALFWVRTFQPLIKASLPQLPAGNERLGFVNSDFRELMKRSHFDLRVGQRFEGEDAERLTSVLRTTADLILRMPAEHIKYPGSSKHVFHGVRPGKGRTENKNSICIDEVFLWSFGSFSVPRNLWQAMARYASWLEPAVLNEWIRLMRRYEGNTGGGPQSWDLHFRALRWLTPEHDISVARACAEKLRSNGSLYCVWTGKHLRRTYAIDHCFPFAAWPCNDLWNLLPSDRNANSGKSNRLPSQEALHAARFRLQDWWTSAYQENVQLKETFEHEARSALPAAVLAGEAITPESLFEGLILQQTVLKRDQQIPEWEPTTT
ncbi:methyltransferase domain-containing protein [Candidatus Foliamicus sp.]